MRKIFSFTLYIALFLVLKVNSYAEITLDFLVVDQGKLQTLYAADLDFLQQGLTGTSEPIFEILVNAPGSPGNPADELYTNCFMYLRLQKDDEILAAWQSDAFVIPDSDIPYHLPNEVLIANTYHFDPANPETQVILRETSGADKLGDIQEDILGSGKLPIGRYSLEVEISYILNSVPRQNMQTFTFLTATNPSYVQLLSPGNEAGFGIPTAVFNEFPVFQWSGNGEEFQVLVFEKRYDFQTVNDVITSKANWASTPAAVQSAMYPQAGEVIPLEFGKIYYWMVKMLVNTSSGTEEINSEVWQFYLADPANQANEQAMLSKNDILAFLQDVLGDKADEITKSLSDYQVSTIKLNGTEISIQELYILLNTYRDAEVEILDLILPE